MRERTLYGRLILADTALGVKALHAYGPANESHVAIVALALDEVERASSFRAYFRNAAQQLPQCAPLIYGPGMPVSALPTVFEVDGDHSLLVRTDYADEAAWQSLLAQVCTPSQDGFVPILKVLDNRVWEGLSVGDIADWARGALSGVVFVADEIATKGPEKTLLVVNVAETPVEDFGRSFRVVASEVWGPENNLRLANLDFSDFADAADETEGIHRGFS